jgi:hypothetical protein
VVVVEFGPGNTGIIERLDLAESGSLEAIRNVASGRSACSTGRRHDEDQEVLAFRGRAPGKLAALVSDLCS